jgi:hypothetical protein
MSTTVAAAGPVPCSEERHERMKWTSVWDGLASIGTMDNGESGALDLRNCPACGSTLCKPIVTQPEHHPVAVVHLDAIEAMSFAQNIRALARDARTPKFVRPLFAKVGQQILSASRIAIAKTGGGQ